MDCFEIYYFIKKKFVADGVFRAELHSFFLRALHEAGYAGMEIKVTPVNTSIIIKATQPNTVVGEDSRRIRELESLIQKRFGYTKENLSLTSKKVAFKGLCASAQAESLKYKLLS